MTEVQESVNEYKKEFPDLGDSRRRLFRLQWQDMVKIIDEKLHLETTFNQAILKDIIKFLRVRRLEYFKKFRSPDDLDKLRHGFGSFYTQ